MRNDTWNGGFLCSDDKYWVSSNLFFMCLSKLKLNSDKYLIPVGYCASNPELSYYVDSLYDDLMGVDLTTQEEKEAFDYVRKIASVLKSWAKNGYSLKVV